VDGSAQPNVLTGVGRRDGPATPLDDRWPHELVNVTFRVDLVSLAHARGRAFLEGTSINALVCGLLEDYSGIHPAPGEEIERRVPRYRRHRVRATDDTYVR
jgi:hypothetical protein